MTLNPTISFEIIPTFSSKLLIVADTSDWKHLSVEPTYIDITLPGSKTPRTHAFQKGKLNKYNSSNLAYGCTVDCDDDLVPLPDGIYKITVSVCEGNTFTETAHYLRTVQLEMALARLLVNMNLECNPRASCVDSYLEIKMLIEGAKADVLFGNIAFASSKYCKAAELLEDLENCDCTPNCN